MPRCLRLGQIRPGSERGVRRIRRRDQRSLLRRAAVTSSRGFLGTRQVWGFCVFFTNCTGPPRARCPPYFCPTAEEPGAQEGISNRETHTGLERAGRGAGSGLDSRCLAHWWEELIGVLEWCRGGHCLCSRPRQVGPPGELECPKATSFLCPVPLVLGAAGVGQSQEIEATPLRSPIVQCRRTAFLGSCVLQCHGQGQPRRLRERRGTRAQVTGDGA